MKLGTLILTVHRIINYKFVNNNKQTQAIKCFVSYNLLVLGPLTMKFGTLMYLCGERNM